MNLVVGIATAGRREIVSRLHEELTRQTRLPDRMVICPAGDDDVEPDVGNGSPFPVDIVRGDRGLPAQRNTILRAIGSADAVLFLDDDFIPARDYIAQAVALLERDPAIVISTGQVIADGINNAGFTWEQAVEKLAADRAPSAEVLRETDGGYGCNMAIRVAPVFEHQVTFDEALPLYGWLEDLDFSRRLAPYGRIVHTNLCRGVHMGVKHGRTSGVRLGYSQIANPIHMVRKGSLPWRHASKMMSRNFMANAGRCLAPEPWIDRRGRLTGNLRAMTDLLQGKLDPRAILEFK